MRIYRSLVALAGATLMMGTASSSYAGHGCEGHSNCHPGVVVHDNQAVTDPVVINVNQPFGHLQTVRYSGTPSVNVMRVHSQPQWVGLSDAPLGFGTGCQPTSTHYCNQNAAPVQLAQPTPVVTFAPTHTVTVDTTHQPRQYGSLEHVPGIAHIPTSIVDRSLENRDAILASGRTVSQPVLHTQRSHHVVQQSPVSHSVSNHAPVYASPVAADGTYWEKTSGLTVFGDTVATQVICRRQLPTRVLRPVIGVPTPVPTPVYCGERVVRQSSRYGTPRSRWTR